MAPRDCRAEFKQKIAGRAEGRPVAQITKVIGISDQSIYAQRQYLNTAPIVPPRAAGQTPVRPCRQSRNGGLEHRRGGPTFSASQTQAAQQRPSQ